MGKSRFHYAVLNMGISGTTTFLKMALSLIVRTIVDQVTVAEYIEVDQVLSLFKSSKAVVATRYHSLILAWLFEKPVVSIAYSDKTTNFINTWYPQQKVITLDELSEKMDLGVMQETAIPVEKLTFLKTQAKKHFDSLGAALNREMG